MYFLIGQNYNILFGWNTKCGCTHIKRIRNFLENNNKGIHQSYEDNYLPENINELIIILIIRNPYKRLVSGFIDKYKDNGQQRHKWLNNKPLTFTNFVDEIVKENWEEIDAHHFIPQTSNGFYYNKLKNHKNLLIYDIENINYTYIETLFNKKIPHDLINNKGGHHNTKTSSINKPVYDLLQIEYEEFKPTLCSFYNETIKQKVYNFYKDDFEYFKEIGFDYKI